MVFFIDGSAKLVSIKEDIVVGSIYLLLLIVNGLRRVTPLIPLKNITELLCLYRIIKEK